MKAFRFQQQSQVTVDILCKIRRFGAVIGFCGWLASIGVGAYAAFAPTRAMAQRALAGEMVSLSVAITATVIYVLAVLAAHIDETQWAVGYSDRLVHDVLSGSEKASDPARLGVK